MRGRKVTFLLMLLSVAITGCASIINGPTCLTEHPKGVVRHPARAGQNIGFVVGIPVMIALLPVTYPIALANNTSGETWDVFIPALAVRDGGAILIGGLPWLAFGWWGDQTPRENIPTTRSSELPPAGAAGSRSP